MFINTVVKKSGVIVMTCCTLCLCAAVIIYSKECSDGAIQGIEMCLKVLVPSLFPFMAISSFIVRSGLSYTLGKPFKAVMRRLFALDECFAPVILLSLMGGYPVGARGISALYQSGAVSEEQAKRAAMFSICSGPGFLINFVGMSLYNNKTVGLIIMISQVISVLVIGIALGLFNRKKINTSKKEISHKIMPIGNSMVEAAYDGARGILNICAFVVLFSAVTGILVSITGDGIFRNIILCTLEVCSAVTALSASCPVEAVAFATGFGGLSVHFQIFSSLGSLKINKLSFFCIRIIQGVITGLLTHLGMKLFVKETAVFSTGEVQQSAASGGTIISGIVLVAVSLCFLYTIKSCKANLRQH